MRIANPLVLLDAGHGGLDPQGRYTTAPNKQYLHPDGWFYEGVWNRKFCQLLIPYLKEQGIQIYQVYHPYSDTPLSSRVRAANEVAELMDDSTPIFISIHSNAFNGKVRGWQIHTTKGETESDRLATAIWNQVDLISEEYGFPMRKQDSIDHDPDYEDNFYVLRNTDMPAVLIENLFFDNYEDVTLLRDPNFCYDLAAQITSGIWNYWA